jgi:DNA-binding MarR family transcriptional regulator
MTSACRVKQRTSAQEAEGVLKLRLWVRLLRSVRVVEVELRRRLRAEFGETLPRFDVMAALARQRAGMTMTEVSRFLMVSNGNVTGIVDRLVAEGMVVRTANARDRRATFVRLTPRGLRHFARMAEAHEGWVNEILAGFGREQAQALVGSLDTLTAAARSGVKER